MPTDAGDIPITYTKVQKYLIWLLKNKLRECENYKKQEMAPIRTISCRLSGWAY